MTFFSKVKITALTVVAVSSSVAMAQSDWKDRFSISGDIRLRLQRDINGSTAGTTGTTDNWMPRVRARIVTAAKVNDQLTANIGWAHTGTTGTTTATTYQSSGRSRNDNMGNWASSKAMGIHIANVDYKLSDSLNIAVGKTNNVFWSAGNTYMIWHAETSFDGGNVRWKGDMGSLKPYAVLEYAHMWERTNNQGNQAASATLGADIAMMGAQVGTTWSADPMSANFAIASYNYNNMKGLTNTTMGCAGTAAACMGNTSDSVAPNVGAFKYDYKLTHAALEFAYNLSFAPISVFTNYIQNGDPSDSNKGMDGGLRVGKVGAPGSWSAAYWYTDLPKDATLGFFADTGFGGGGTDAIYHTSQFSYRAWQNSTVSVYWTAGRKNVASTPYDYEAWYFDWTSTF